jgi:hypothetical protein
LLEVVEVLQLPEVVPTEVLEQVLEVIEILIVQKLLVAIQLQRLLQV